MDLIIYHRDCPDGFCSAFIAKKKYPNAQLIGKTYGEDGIPDVIGKEVLVVDFSWKRQIMLNMYERSESLLVLDHHKTAQAELDGLHFAIFDMERSGATLTWDTLFPKLPRPWYVPYIEDRDLWHWSLPSSKEVSGFIMALPHTIEAWQALDVMNASDAVQAGKAIRIHIDHYIEKVVAQRRIGTLSGHKAAIVCAAYPNISDVGNELCKHAEIGLGWFERGDGQMQFSLRSVGELDVAEIAKLYGGGGHKNASGFQVPLGEGRRILDSMFGR